LWQGVKLRDSQTTRFCFDDTFTREHHIEQSNMEDDIADRDAEIAMLMGMGATVDEATCALEESGWDIDRAMDQL